MKNLIEVLREKAWYIVVFLVVSLVGIGLVMANVRQGLFADNYEFTINFLKGFHVDIVGSTISAYILWCILIYFLVDDYLLSPGVRGGKDKSGGKSKKNKKQSNWAKKKDIRKISKRVDARESHYTAAGVPLMSNGKYIYVDDGEAHSLIVGSTGAGKTRRFVLPLIMVLAKKGESIIMTDPKGELYHMTSEMLRDYGYDIILINLREPKRGNAWNPLHLPYKLYTEGKRDKSVELLDDLSINIIGKANEKDPFWDNASAGYFVGLALSLFDNAEADKINLNSINFMSTTGSENFSGDRQYVDEYFSTIDPNSPAYISASPLLFASGETRTSLMSVFKQKIKIFSSKEDLSAMMADNDFDIADIGKKKTAVFIVIQDEKKTYHGLATIFVKQCYETLIDVAQENKGQLPIRTNFILDEFANMPPLTDVTTMITAARSRKIRFNLIIQNFSQLNQVYGKDEAETIKGNCGNLIYLLSRELGVLEEISKLAGNVKDKDGKEEPLITVSQLQTLKMGTMLLLKTRVAPFKTELPDISKYRFNEQGFKNGHADFPERIDERKYGIFDLKEFVKEKRRKKLYDILAKDDSLKLDDNDSNGDIKQSPLASKLNLNFDENGKDELLEEKEDIKANEKELTVPNDEIVDNEAIDGNNINTEDLEDDSSGEPNKKNQR